jgi:phage FluMu protein Com
MKNRNLKWRCQRCRQVLGEIDGDQLEIRMARGHQYRVSFPVTCVCKSPDCKALNVLRRPPSGNAPQGVSHARA